MGRRRFYTRDVIILCLLVCILAFSSGVFYGASKTMNMCIDLGFKILEKKNISMNNLMPVNQDFIKYEIARYQNLIGG